MRYTVEVDLNPRAEDAFVAGIENLTTELRDIDPDISVTIADESVRFASL